jgi:hypothetical protein
MIRSKAEFYPNVAKVEGFQRQGAEGAAVVNRLQALGKAGSGALRLCPGGKSVHGLVSKDFFTLQSLPKSFN